MTANARKDFRGVQRSLFAALPVLLLALAPAAVTAQTTADRVNDKGSLKAFVLDARRYIGNITNFNELAGLRDTLRKRGTWVSGETFLMLAQANGFVAMLPGAPPGRRSAPYAIDRARPRGVGTRRSTTNRPAHRRSPWESRSIAATGRPPPGPPRQAGRQAPLSRPALAG